MRVTFHARTDRGRRRQTNEDAFATSDEDGFCVLCDGMGGHASGEVAARTAVEVLAARARVAIPRAGGPRPPREVERVRALLPGLVEEWLREANAAVFARGSGAPEGGPKAGRRMGTTLALLCVVEDFAVAAHIGDSRIYLLRDGGIEPLTRDHTVLASALPAPPPPDASGRRKRKYVTRALGTRPEVQADLVTIDVKPGDRFVVCSDGLTDFVRDHEIRGAVEVAGAHLDAAARILIDLANARGGRDNITVIVGAIAPETALAGAAGGGSSVAAPLAEAPPGATGSRAAPPEEADPAPPPPLEPPPPWDTE